MVSSGRPNLPVVVNPAAGRGRAETLTDTLVAAARALGFEPDLHRPNSAADATALFTDLATRGAERVVAVGGDGMVHIAANALVGTTTGLGIVSAGTGNDTATALGLPADISAAMAAAIGPLRAIDTLKITQAAAYNSVSDSPTSTTAVTIATLGLSVDVNERAEQLRWPTGAWAYTAATIVEIPRRHTRHMTISVDGVSADHHVTFVAIANTAYFGGGMKIAPGARFDDGLLDVVVIGATPRRDLLRLLPAARAGRHVRDGRVTITRGSEVCVTSHEPAAARADGEPVGRAPIKVAVDPASLLVAASFTAH